MFASLKHHLRCAEDRLCGEFVSLRAWHAVPYSGISHRLNEHIDIGRGGSADSGHGIHQCFRDDLAFSETVENGDDRIEFFRCHIVIRCECGHCL